MVRPVVVRSPRTDEDVAERKALLTQAEASDLLGIGRTSLYGLLRSKELRSVRLGRSIRIPRTEIDALIARKLDELEWSDG